MGATGILVHASLVYISPLQACLDIHDQLLHCLHMNLRQTVHEYASLRIFSDLKVLTGLVLVIDVHERGRGRVAKSGVRSIATTCLAFEVWDDKQVSDVLHVDFEETDCDSKHGLVWILFNVVEDVLDSTRHNTKLILRGRLWNFALVQLDFGCQGRLLLLPLEIALAAKNRVRLSRSCLPVRHDYTVEAV